MPKNKNYKGKEKASTYRYPWLKSDKPKSKVGKAERVKRVWSLLRPSSGSDSESESQPIASASRSAENAPLLRQSYEVFLPTAQQRNQEQRADQALQEHIKPALPARPIRPERAGALDARSDRPPSYGSIAPTRPPVPIDHSRAESVIVQIEDASGAAQVVVGRLVDRGDRLESMRNAAVRGTDPPLPFW
ncbi:hypothetical protein BC832DRAFT_540114 [Gaertneriomyces semiglobifer]|nr:hypothetical protein BC832DRAFT_540114 [Gaertneriomyces semiglobifer]